MTYFVVNIDWSVTDTDTLIVSAPTEWEARHIVENRYPTARYIFIVAQTDTIIDRI